MSVYNVNGESISSVYGLGGTSLNSAYDINGSDVYSGGERPDRTKAAYDYYADQDPDKGYTWSYSLADLKELQNGHFTIGVQTDTHYNGQNKTFAIPLKNMTKQLYFDFICNLGDIPQGYSQDTAQTTRNSIEEMISRYTQYVEAPVFLANGNHDNASMNGPIIPNADMYTYYVGTAKRTQGVIDAGTPNEYYYKDFYECRVIVLNTCEYTENHAGVAQHYITLDQVAWLTNTALDTDKPVIIIGHTPLTGDLTEDTVQNRDAVISALQNFMNNGGTVVAYLCGHIHAQRSIKINGINHIAFANGGTFAEILFIDFDLRKITTKVMNNGNISDREFTF